jgi:hypothetical protein
MNGFLPISNYFRIPGLRISALSSGPVMPAVVSPPAPSVMTPGLVGAETLGSFGAYTPPEDLQV